MAIKQIERANWGAYFEAYSSRLMRTRRIDYAEIRILSMEDGVQREAGWLPLAGITYDRKDDLLEIQVDNLDHLVYRPDAIYVDEMNDGKLASLEVVRHDGTTEIIELR